MMSFNQRLRRNMTEKGQESAKEWEKERVENELKFKSITKVANTLISYASLFRCSLEDAWDIHLPTYFTDKFSFEEVKVSIDEKVIQGKLFQERYWVDDKEYVDLLTDTITDLTRKNKDDE